MTVAKFIQIVVAAGYEVPDAGGGASTVHDILYALDEEGNTWRLDAASGPNGLSTAPNETRQYWRPLTNDRGDRDGK